MSNLPDPIIALGLTAAAVGTNVAENLVDGVNHIPLSTAVAIIGGLWWLSARLQKGSDKLAEHAKKLAKMDEKLDAMKAELDARPCAVCDMESLIKVKK